MNKLFVLAFYSFAVTVIALVIVLAPWAVVSTTLEALSGDGPSIAMVIFLAWGLMAAAGAYVLQEKERNANRKKRQQKET